MMITNSKCVVSWCLLALVSTGCSADLGIFFETLGETTTDTSDSGESSSGELTTSTGGDSFSESEGSTGGGSESETTTSGGSSLEPDPTLTDMGGVLQCEDCNCDVDCIRAHCELTSCKGIADAQKSDCELELFDDYGEFNLYTLFRGDTPEEFIAGVYCDNTWTYKLVTEEEPRTTPEAMVMCASDFNMELFYPTSREHLESAVEIARMQDDYTSAKSHLRIMAIENHGAGESCWGKPFRGPGGCEYWGPPQGPEHDWFIREEAISEAILSQPPLFATWTRYWVDNPILLGELIWHQHIEPISSNRYICTVYDE